MAEDFPLNLDDGELWLPSDVIRAVGVCRYNDRRVSDPAVSYPADCAAVDGLTQKLASFGLLERCRAMHTAKPYNGLYPNPDVFHGQGRHVLWSSLGRAGHRNPVEQRAAGVLHGDVGAGAFFPDSSAVHKFYPGKPLDGQADGAQLERARVLQRHLHGDALHWHMPARVNGSRRESGGTGVFLPRLAPVDSKNKHLNTVKGSVQFRQRQPIRDSLLEKQPASFPHDWTF